MKKLKAANINNKKIKALIFIPFILTNKKIANSEAGYKKYRNQNLTWLRSVIIET
jgi:hypothetical protein